MKNLLLSVVLLGTLAAVPAFADSPIFSLDRVSASVGPSVRWKGAGTTLAPREFLAGGQIAYQVVPHLSVSGTANYNFTSKEPEYQLGLRLRVK